MYLGIVQKGPEVQAGTDDSGTFSPMVEAYGGLETGRPQRAGLWEAFPRLTGSFASAPGDRGPKASSQLEPL